MSMRYEVSIPANVAAISPVVDAVMARIHKEHARAEEIEFAIETALREASPPMQFSMAANKMPPRKFIAR